MSAGQRFPAEAAQRVADELLAVLTSVCERIVIVGSLRRQKKEVGDVELLYIPRIELRPDPTDIFGTLVPTNLADAEIAWLEKARVLTRRLNVRGNETYGPKNKLMRHFKSGLPVDLFATTRENWFVSLVVRTGSLETNLRLTKGAIARGSSLEAYGAGVRSNGHLSVATSEADVFRMCGVPFIVPEQR